MKVATGGQLTSVQLGMQLEPTILVGSNPIDPTTASYLASNEIVYG
jgi:hypothetical protein